MDKITPQEARKILDEHKDDDNFTGVIKDYFQAIAEGTLPRHYYERLKLKRSYSDDLPEPNVSSEHPNYRFLRLKAGWDHPAHHHLKCLGGCIIGFSLDLQGCVDQELIFDPGIRREIYNFVHYPFNCAKGGKGEFWTLPEEIFLINNTLDKVIQYLERTYGLIPALPSP